MGGAGRGVLGVVVRINGRCWIRMIIHGLRVCCTLSRVREALIGRDALRCLIRGCRLSSCRIIIAYIRSAVMVTAHNSKDGHGLRVPVEKRLS